MSEIILSANAVISAFLAGGVVSELCLIINAWEITVYNTIFWRVESSNVDTRSSTAKIQFSLTGYSVTCVFDWTSYKCSSFSISLIWEMKCSGTKLPPSSDSLKDGSSPSLALWPLRGL